MPRVIYNKVELLADWKTGKYTERDIASKYRISPATAHKLVTGVSKSISPLISKQVEINQELATMNEHEVSKFKQEVDERSKHIQFFTEAAVKNVKAAVDKIVDTTSQAEHRMLADTILKGRETVLGKAPETAIQINTNGNTQMITKEMSAQDAARAYADMIACKR